MRLREKMRTREAVEKPQTNAYKSSFKSEKAGKIFWNLSSEMIGVYLWFLRFSNILLKLVQ